MVGCAGAARSVGMKTFRETWKRLVSFFFGGRIKRNTGIKKNIGLQWRDLFYDFRKGVSGLSQDIWEPALIQLWHSLAFWACILYRYLAHAHTTGRTHHDASAGYTGFSSGLSWNDDGYIYILLFTTKKRHSWEIS